MLISKFQKTSAEEIVRQLGHIPQQLQMFLEKYNGGETPETSFSIGNISSDIVGFYGIGAVKYSYSDVSTVRYKDTVFLPIAFDSFGNQIVISIEDGEIRFLDHEKENEPAMLCRNLHEFIDNVQSSPVNPNHVKPVEQREEELRARGKENIISDALRDLWKKEIAKYSNIHQEPVEF